MEVSVGSITNWFLMVQSGDQDGAQRLWDRFSRRLLGLCGAKLIGTPRRAADEEDVVLSAFDSFCRGVENGRFSKLEDREDLWHLLVVITVRKAINLRTLEGRLKRGGSNHTPLPASAETCLEDILSREPGPELAAILAEEMPDSSASSVTTNCGRSYS